MERFKAKGCWLCSSLWLRFSGSGCCFKRQLAITSEPETVAVIFEVNGTGGTLAAAADGDSIKSKGRVEKGKTAIFTAVPQSGYHPNAWTITGGKILAGGKQGDTSATVKLTSDITSIVSFKPIPPSLYTVTATHGAHGSLTAAPAPVGGKAAKDSEMTFTATPDSGYKVDMWFVSGGEILSGGNDEEASVTVKISANTTVRVTFKAASPAPAAEMVAVTMTHGDNGNLTAAPALVDGKAAKDSEITFIASPKAGYAVDAWTVTPASALKADGKAGDLLAKVKITAATTVHVTFKKAAAPAAEMVAVTMTHGDNGDLTAVPAPVDGKAAKDSEITFIASPKAGYAVDAWTVTPASALKADGKAGDLLAKVKITAATTVHVTFIAICLEI